MIYEKCQVMVDSLGKQREKVHGLWHPILKLKLDLNNDIFMMTCSTFTSPVQLHGIFEKLTKAGKRGQGLELHSSLLVY